MKHYCWQCKVEEIDEPEYCCRSGNMYGTEYPCGCMGYPIDPPFCESCYEEVFGKPTEERG